MKLFIDVGNTAMKFATNENQFSYLGRFFTRELSKEKLDNLLSNISTIDSVYVASVVPNANKFLDEYFQNKYSLTINEIKVNDYPGLKICIDNKDELGMDLYCDLVGAYKKYGPSTLVIDLGTASKILLIDKNGIFSSCVILPGIEMSRKVLSLDTALLPRVDIKDIKKISDCHNTADVISSSTYYGQVEMINGLIRRYEDEIGYHCKHVFTGGNALEIIKNISGEYVLEENLCLKGIAEIVK